MKSKSDEDSLANVDEFSENYQYPKVPFQNINNPNISPNVCNSKLKKGEKKNINLMNLFKVEEDHDNTLLT